MGHEVVDVNGSWFVGACSTDGCGEQQMVRTTQNAPHFNRGWCYVCKNYTVAWRWIRVTNAITIDGNVPLEKP